MDLKLLDSFLRIGRQRNHDHIRLRTDNRCQALTEERVIIDDQDANWCAKCQGGTPSGVSPIVAKSCERRHVKTQNGTVGGPDLVDLSIPCVRLQFAIGLFAESLMISLESLSFLENCRNSPSVRRSTRNSSSVRLCPVRGSCCPSRVDWSNGVGGKASFRR